MIEFHEAANIFPLDEAGIPDLAKSIREHGQIDDIEVMNGKIIDGRRRFKACELAGVKPRFKEISVADPVAYALARGLNTRSLTATQRAMVAARAREIYDRQAKERQKEAAVKGNKTRAGKDPVPVVENLPEPGRARDAVGKAVGVSGKSVDYATKVLNQGTEKLIAAVDNDDIAVSTAARAASLTEAEQDAIADRAPEGRKRVRPAEEAVADDQDEVQERKVLGKGVILAHEAINCLTRIPKNDALRKQGFRLVTDWIKRNP